MHTREQWTPERLVRPVTGAEDTCKEDKTKHLKEKGEIKLVIFSGGRYYGQRVKEKRGEKRCSVHHGKPASSLGL